MYSINWTSLNQSVQVEPRDSDSLLAIPSSSDPGLSGETTSPSSWQQNQPPGSSSTCLTARVDSSNVLHSGPSALWPLETGDQATLGDKGAHQVHDDELSESVVCSAWPACPPTSDSIPLSAASDLSSSSWLACDQSSDIELPWGVTDVNVSWAHSMDLGCPLAPLTSDMVADNDYFGSYRDREALSDGEEAISPSTEYGSSFFGSPTLSDPTTGTGYQAHFDSAAASTNTYQPGSRISSATVSSSPWSLPCPSLETLALSASSSPPTSFPLNFASLAELQLASSAETKACNSLAYEPAPSAQEFIYCLSAPAVPTLPTPTHPLAMRPGSCPSFSACAQTMRPVSASVSSSSGSSHQARPAVTLKRPRGTVAKPTIDKKTGRPISPITGLPTKVITKRGWPPKDLHKRVFHCPIEGCDRRCKSSETVYLTAELHVANASE